MNLLSEHARELLRMPPEWEAFRFEAIGGSFGVRAKLFKVTGAIAPLKMRGKNKGRRNWKRRDKETERTAYFSPQEHDDWLQKWEAKNGQCSECQGKGKTISGWSVDAGDRWSECKKCHGTGLPQ